MKIVECVPNFSEGRDIDKIERIMSVVKTNAFIRLINYESDADYNRTVVTLVGEPDKMVDLILDLTKICLQEIDLNHHSGEHARMGAIDVIPFIPISDISMAECVALSEQCARRINEKYDIPVFLYAEAAKKPERELLPNIRKGEFEGMKTKIQESEWKPDFGKPEIHPTFGTVAVGARDFLIAYNIDLATEDENPAKQIAKAIRKSSGGFQYIQAGPVYLENRKHTQVTMNILNYKKNPIYRIFETVRMEAKQYQVEVTGAEIVGLIPKDALIRSLKYYYKSQKIAFPENISFEMIVEDARKYLLFRDFNETKIIDYFL
ncbi:MAG: glutamate formimidoyltransferase [Bacilli bacterium]|nr:glutamate formimidoyltransferase [Bacilli bacterium]MBN2876353.1 glutamate formimidoyltransferase [Bacilli bacterium]